MALLMTSLMTCRHPRSSRVRLQRRRLFLLLGFPLLTGAIGCKDLTGNPGLPAGVQDPSVYDNASGALRLRTGALQVYTTALQRYILAAGLLTDELSDPNTGASAGQLLSTSGVPDPVDERLLTAPPSGSLGGDSYQLLQDVRGSANLALGALATYDTAPADTALAHVLRGELYALQGYAELMLADLFCSGVPLSTLVYHGDFVYAPSSTTTQVYRAALAKFDTALQVGRGSDSVVHLAQVGQGRAYLALEKYDSAAAVVAGVPDNFQYTIPAELGGGANGLVNFLNSPTPAFHSTVSDQEGENGLPYRSNGDPRTAVLFAGSNTTTGDSMWFPAKYCQSQSGCDFVPVVVASGIEARLIQAEAQLQPASAPSGPWLATLNALRADAATNTASLGYVIPNLTSLSDPGLGVGNADSAATLRIKLLFQERAYWLFADGHRQGDLRRLLRQYSQYQAFQSQAQVYPTGPYRAPGAGTYGTDVTIPVAASESVNPYYHGCLDRNP